MLELALSAIEVGVYRSLFAARARFEWCLDEALMGGCGIGFGDFEVLAVLGESEDGSMRLSELADQTLLSRSALSRRIDALCALGWVRRRSCPTDRRGTFAVITEEGREKLVAGLPVFHEVLHRELGSKLDREELEELSGLLSHLENARCDQASS